MAVLCRASIVLGSLLTVLSLEVDPNGYVLYCPCMGRFGNQADHFLGALSFAFGLNRTLALPPWIVYPSRPVATSSHVPFKEWFQVSPLKEYHRVISMEDFMHRLAPEIWPPGKRYGFCYGTPGSQCHMKQGNPFGPFWDRFRVDFDKSVTYQNLPFSTSQLWVRDQWDSKFPPRDYPVLAFMGAPAAFPVAEQDKWLQKYVKWSNPIAKQAQEFITRELPDGPWVGIHLRNGIDWVRACDHIDGVSNMMASPQCMGYKPQAKLTASLCLPEKQDVLKDVKRAVKAIKAKGVYVATDNDPMLNDLSKHLKSLKAKVVSQGGHQPSPQLDLAILAQADHFIGNCVSSFTAFAVRERDAAGRTSSFFGFDRTKRQAKIEL